MAAARLGCKRTVVGTGWANSWPGCMSRLRKCYSHLSGGSFLAGKASWALSGCLPIESADHCMLVNEGAWLRSRVCLRKGGTGGGGWGHPQGDVQGAVHMAAARLGCKRTVVGTGWANSWPGCMSRLRKCYSHLSGGSFLAGKASWALSGCLPMESADHCMLANEGAWLRSRVCLLRLEVELGSVLESELWHKWRYGALKVCLG